jgi:hypothetical protein
MFRVDGRQTGSYRRTRSYPEVLYEVCERKTSVFRPPKLPPLSILI